MVCSCWTRADRVGDVAFTSHLRKDATTAGSRVRLRGRLQTAGITPRHRLPAYRRVTMPTAHAQTAKPAGVNFMTTGRWEESSPRLAIATAKGYCAVTRVK
jgi:hypothetical protein